MLDSLLILASKYTGHQIYGIRAAASVDRHSHPRLQVYHPVLDCDVAGIHQCGCPLNAQLVESFKRCVHVGVAGLISRNALKVICNTPVHYKMPPSWHVIEFCALANLGCAIAFLPGVHQASMQPC